MLVTTVYTYPECSFLPPVADLRGKLRLPSAVGLFGSYRRGIGTQSQPSLNSNIAVDQIAVSRQGRGDEELPVCPASV